MWLCCVLMFAGVHAGSRKPGNLSNVLAPKVKNSENRNLLTNLLKVEKRGKTMAWVTQQSYFPYCI